MAASGSGARVARRITVLTVVLGLPAVLMVALIASPWSPSAPRQDATTASASSVAARPPPVPTTPGVEASSTPSTGGTLPPPTAEAPRPSPSLVPAPSPSVPVGVDCETRSGARERARELLAGRLVLPPFEAVPMPRDPTWTENPLGDRHWEFQYHSLRFIWDLVDEWRATQDDRARDLAVFLVRDWVHDNPPGRARSPWAWNDHATAQRTLVLACVAETFPGETWIRSALATHGRVLADPAFYVGQGNHALNQDRGLLAAACFLGRTEWTRLATDRLRTLVRESVDDQGVTNEQAVFYQGYNYRDYSLARSRLRACGVEDPPELDRIDRMPGFLAHATLPDRTYVALGDTERNRAVTIPGTIAEFAATAGAAGPEPGSTYARYDAGFLFSRTGWGDDRPFADEVAMSLRFGPPRRFHGHDDGGSVTLYGFGRRLIADPGVFTYNFDAWHDFALSRRAHNVVIVPGLAYDATVRTRLVRATTSSTHDDTTVSNAGYAGVAYQRRVIFSHSLGYLVIEDRLTSARSRRFEQLWHLDAGLRPVVTGSSVRTEGDGGSVRILQLIGNPAIDVVTGQRDPVQGWVSFELGHRTPAPVVSATLEGRGARFLTVVVPAASGDVPVSVTDVVVSGDAWSLVVDVGGQRERVAVRGTGSSVTSP
jgi:hypothetical protein